MSKEIRTTVALVLPESIVEWLDKKAEEADTNRSQVTRVLLRKIKESEEQS